MIGSMPNHQTAPVTTSTSRSTESTTSSTCTPAYAVMRRRLGGDGAHLTSSLTGCILPDPGPTGGGAGTTSVRVLAPLTAAADPSRLDVVPARHRGAVM